MAYTYSKEAMDKALEMCHKISRSFCEDHETPKMLATYIQQVSDAAKQADEALKKEKYHAKGEIRAELGQLILSDPVDPLLQEAREIAAKVARRQNFCSSYIEEILNGNVDQYYAVQSTLEALKSRESKNLGWTTSPEGEQP